MIDWIKEIPGPTFLLYFFLFATAMYIFYRILIPFLDNSLEESEKAKKFDTKIDSFEALILRYRRDKLAVTKTILLSLISKGFLIHEGSKNLKNAKKENITELVDYEKTVHNYFSTSKTLTLVTLRDLYLALKPKIEKTISILQGKKLLRYAALMEKIQYLYFFMFSVTLFFPVTKLILGISRDKPVGLLIFLVILTFILWLCSIPALRATKSGKEYLKNLKENISHSEINFSKNDTTTNNSENNNNNNNVLLLAAGLGVGALLLTPAFSGYSSYVEPYSSSSSGSDSSGGGGCGSSSDSGGGCGGCGGGGD